MMEKSTEALKNRVFVGSLSKFCGEYKDFQKLGSSQ